MDAENSTEQTAAPSAVGPSHAAAGTAAAVIPPPADHSGEAPGLGSPGQLPSSVNSILKGARLGQKTEQFAIGTAGLTSNTIRGVADKFTSAVIPGIAKAVLRAIVPRGR